MEIQAVLDAGSQRSYITERAKKALKLKPKDKQPMFIMTFGAQCVKALTCEVVRTRMKLRDDQNQELQLFVDPQICEPLTAQLVTSVQRNLNIYFTFIFQILYWLDHPFVYLILNNVVILL